MKAFATLGVIAAIGIFALTQVSGKQQAELEESGWTRAALDSPGPGEPSPEPVPEREFVPRAAESAPLQELPPADDSSPVEAAEAAEVAEEVAVVAGPQGPVPGPVNSLLAVGALHKRAQRSPLELESSVKRRGSEWVVRWSVRNIGASAVYVVSQLPAAKAGRVEPAPGRVYLRGTEGVLHVSKRMWRVPRGVRPLAPELPYLQRLGPGEVIEGGVRLPAAVASSYPYRRSAPTLQRVQRVQVSVGYFCESAAPRASGGGLFRVAYEQLEAQEILTGEAHPARLSVR